MIQTSCSANRKILNYFIVKWRGQTVANAFYYSYNHRTDPARLTDRQKRFQMLCKNLTPPLLTVPSNSSPRSATVCTYAANK